MTSTIKVNKIEKVDGSTIELGGPGTSVNLASGATQTGFGRTGTVDWCTTAKTSPFTAVSGDGFFINTSCGAITVTLPSSPSAGDIVSFADYANTWNSNNVTVCRGGSKINGACANALLSTQGQSVTLIYVDGTRGWKNTMDSTSDVTGAPSYVIATGGTITTCGDFKVHTFLSSGCFQVTNGGFPSGSNTVDYFVVAGGGGGGEGYGGGGAAGGFRLASSLGIPAPTMSPLATPTALPVSIQTYPITVGAGGAGFQGPAGGVGANGSASVFSTITSTGGGRGGAATPSQPERLGNPGGSGGGNGSSPAEDGSSIPTGNTPPVSPPQGNNGNRSYNYLQPPQYGGAGGGGAGAAGCAGCGSNLGKGGIGSFVSPVMAGSNGTTGPVPSVRYFAGGGGGSNCANHPQTLNDPAGAGGAGGGGNAGQPNYPAQSGPAKNRSAAAGGTNTGGGGGASSGPGGSKTDGSAAGGSGIVIIRYKFQN